MSLALQRIAWKERKFLRSITVACLAILVFALLLTCVLYSGPRHVSAGDLFTGLFTLVGCVVGLATGIILFVPEREMETDLFLGRLPVTSSGVARTKLLHGTLWFVLFLVAAAIVAISVYQLRYGRSLLSLRDYSGTHYIMTVVIPIDCFAWSVASSIYFRHAITAVVSAALAVLASFVVLAFLSTEIASVFFGLRSASADSLTFLLLHVIQIVALILYSTVAGQTWLRGGNETGNKARLMGRTNASDQAAFSDSKPAFPWRALVWQSMRMHRTAIALISAGLILISFVTGYCLLNVMPELLGHRGLWAVRDLFFTTNLFWCIAGTLVGLLVFQADQTRNGVLFFQQQADYPRKLWAARMAMVLILFPVVLLSAFAMFAPMWIGVFTSNINIGSRNVDDSVFTWAYGAISTGVAAWIFLISASVAQLISLIFRWSILAFAIAGGVSLGLWQYVNYLVLLGVPLWLYAMPVALACLGMSWWIAPRWVSRRKFKRCAICAVTVPIVTFVASFAALVATRATQVPEPPDALAFSADYERDFNRYTSNASELAEQFPAAGKIKQAIDNIEPVEELAKQLQIPDQFNSGWPSEWTPELTQLFVESNSQWIEQIQQAVADAKAQHVLNPASSLERSTQAGQIEVATSADVEMHLHNGNIDGSLHAIVADARAAWHTSDRPIDDVARSLENFVRWSALDGQTDRSIRNGIDQLVMLQNEVFAKDNNRLSRERYYFLKRFFGDSDIQDSYVLGRDRYYPEYFRQSPWELERNRRIMMNEYWFHPRSWAETCEMASESRDHMPVKDNKVRQSRWRDHSTIDSFDDMFAGVRPIVNCIRYTKVRMALVGFRLKHGAYPDSLSQLAGDGDEHYFTVLPCDAWSGLPFAYSGTGLRLPTFFESERQMYVSGQVFPVPQREFVVENVMPSNTPFLIPWSAMPVERSFSRKSDQLDDSELIADAIELETGNWIAVPDWARYPRVPHFADEEDWKLN